jgi:hypothetical protein
MGPKKKPLDAPRRLGRDLKWTPGSSGKRPKRGPRGVWERAPKGARGPGKRNEERGKRNEEGKRRRNQIMGAPKKAPGGPGMRSNRCPQEARQKVSKEAPWGPGKGFQRELSGAREREKKGPGRWNQIMKAPMKVPGG